MKFYSEQLKKSARGQRKMRHIGIDLHQTNFTVCWLEEEEARFEKYDLKELEEQRPRSC
jgi:hypothetical protein